jgi:hypothetical protein
LTSSPSIGHKRLPLVEKYLFNSVGLDSSVPSSPAPGDVTESDFDSVNEENNNYELDEMIMNQMICFEVCSFAILFCPPRLTPHLSSAPLLLPQWSPIAQLNWNVRKIFHLIVPSRKGDTLLIVTLSSLKIPSFPLALHFFIHSLPPLARPPAATRNRHFSVRLIIAKSHFIIEVLGIAMLRMFMASLDLDLKPRSPHQPLLAKTKECLPNPISIKKSLDLR